MTATIIQFAQICRAAGMPVSSAEVLDAMGQLEWIDLAEEKQFETVLKANFAKNLYHQAIFANLYNYFFHHLPNIKRTRRPPAAGKGTLPLRGITRDSATGGASREELLDLLAWDPLAHLDLLLKIQSADLDITQLHPSCFAAGEGSLTSARSNRMKARIRELWGRDFPFGDESLRLYCQEYLVDTLPNGRPPGAGKGAHSLVPRPFHRKPARRGPANLGEIPFQQLTAAETRAVHTLIARLAAKYKDRITRRERLQKKKLVDIRKTIRKSAQYEGLPMKLAWRKRPPKKPKVVALCDVSYSVWAAVPFMLNILYSLQDCFRQVKSFVFIARIAPVSDIFARLETMAAIDQVMDSYELHYPRSAVYGGETEKVPLDADPEISDYGSALAEFLEKFSDTLDRRTTLMILGDGRNNFLPPGADILKKMKEKCRRIIWLNPEPEALWGDGDSEIFAYRPHLQELRPCSNLQELAAFVSDFLVHPFYGNG